MAERYEYYLNDPDGVLWYNSSVGNSFTVGTVGPNEYFYINSISVELKKEGNPPEPLYFEIYQADSNGMPREDLGVLSSGTLSGVSDTFSWYNVSMSSYRLKASTKYIFLIRVKGGDGSNRYIMKIDGAGTYAGGELISYDGTDYTLYSDYDAAFEIWGLLEGFLDIDVLAVNGVKLVENHEDLGITPQIHPGELVTIEAIMENLGAEDNFLVETHKDGVLYDSVEVSSADPEFSPDGFWGYAPPEFTMPDNDVSITVNTYHWEEAPTTTFFNDYFNKVVMGMIYYHERGGVNAYGPAGNGASDKPCSSNPYLAWMTLYSVTGKSGYINSIRFWSASSPTRICEFVVNVDGTDIISDFIDAKSGDWNYNNPIRFENSFKIDILISHAWGYEISYMTDT